MRADDDERYGGIGITSPFRKTRHATVKIFYFISALKDTQLDRTFTTKH